MPRKLCSQQGGLRCCARTSTVFEKQNLCDCHVQAASAEVGKENAVRIANYLCPGNYAVSGSKEACDAVEKLGKSYKARCVRGVRTHACMHAHMPCALCVAELEW